MSNSSEMKLIGEMLQNADQYQTFKTAVIEYHNQGEDVGQWPNQCADELLNYALSDLDVQNAFVKGTDIRTAYDDAYLRYNAWKERVRKEQLSQTYNNDTNGYLYDKYNMDLATKDDSDGEEFDGTAEMPSGDDLLKKKHSWHNSVEDDTPRDLLKCVLTRCKNTSPVDDNLLVPPPRIRRLRPQSPIDWDIVPELELVGSE